MKIRTDLTAERVRELLDYDPVTGSLTWTSPMPTDPVEGGKAGALAKAGSKYQFRRFIQVDGRRFPAHRIVWLHAHGTLPDGYIVPENGDYDDLRLGNLKVLNASEAARRGGARRSNTSGYRGVTWAKHKGRWLAYITHNYKRVHVGYFKTIEEAVAARNKAADNLDLLPALDKSDLEAKANALNRDAKLRTMWRRVLRQTNNVTKWSRFDEFARDVGDPPEANGRKMILVPLRPEETIGPGNFKWKVVESQWDYSTREGKENQRRFHRENNRNSYRDKSLRAAFGLSLEEYERMSAAQGGRCACCGEPERVMRHGRPLWLAVDHCHATGRIRSLLCSHCNKGIGHFRDDPSLLRKAAAYLERHANKSDGAALDQPPDKERDAHHGYHSLERP